MRIEDLKYLLEIDRSKSINKAAQNLFLSHSTLSYLLQNIERELGYQIFMRSKRGVIPTARGQEVLNGCRIILDLIDGWHEQSDNAKEISGHVQVTAVPIFARMFGMDMLMNLRKEYPGINLRFEEKKLFFLDRLLNTLNKSTSRIFISTLGDSERDVFEHMFQSSVDWDCACIGVDELVLHISSHHPLSSRDEIFLEELNQLPLLFYPDSDGQFGYNRILRYFSASKTFNTSTAEQVLNMVAKNLCVSLASRLDTSRSNIVLSGAVRRVPIHAFSMPMNYCILYPSSLSISAAEQIVVEGLKNCVSVPLESYNSPNTSARNIIETPVGCSRPCSSN